MADETVANSSDAAAAQVREDGAKRTAKDEQAQRAADAKERGADGKAQ